MELTAVLTPAEEGGYIALNPETGTTTQGETVEEALANLKEATALYLSEFPLPGTRHPLVTQQTGSDQAGCAIEAGLGEKRGRLWVLNRCFRGPKRAV